MNTGYLFFIPAGILFSTALIINVHSGRRIGARKLSLYRQITLAIVGIPILIGLFSEGELLNEKLSLKQLIALGMMLLGCIIVVLL